MTEQKPTSSPSSNPRSVFLGFAEMRPNSRGDYRLKLRLGRILILLLVLGSTAWMGKSVAFYYFFKSVRDFEAVTFTDMLIFPLNRNSVRSAQGDYQIEMGKEAMEREDYRRALSMLQNGVARSPENLEGRMLLVRLYAGWRPELAIDLLEQGLEYGRNNEEFIQIYCLLLSEKRQDDDLLALTESILDDSSTPDEVKKIAAAHRMKTSILHGDFAVAESTYENSPLKDTADGIFLTIDLLEKANETRRAAALLETIIGKFSDQNIEPYYKRLIRLYQNLENYERARELALDLTIRDPMAWDSRIILIEILNESDFEERAEKEVQAVLREHRHDERAMLTLGQVAADLGLVQTANRLYELALENNFDLGVFSLILIEAYISDNQYEPAIQLCNDLVQEKPDWLAAMESTFNGLRSLAYFGAGNEELGRLYLKNFRQSPRTEVRQLEQAAISFRTKGMPDYAYQLLDEAHRRDDRDEDILGLLIEVQMETGISYNLADNVMQLIDLRRPNYSLLEKIHTALNSDRFVFTPSRPRLLESLDMILKEPLEANVTLFAPTQAEG